MKPVIYQIFTRLFANAPKANKNNGTIADNGCAKMADINATTLKRINKLGMTHVWYTGVIRHATTTDYSAYGIPTQHPAIVKGNAGSPYAITDYYDIDPDLATDVDKRMEEFEQLVERTHAAGLKVIIDFVPNHVARQYKSICKPKGVVDLGEDDDKNMNFSAQNNFYYCGGQSFSPSIDLAKGSDTPYEETPAKATGNDNFSPWPSINDWYETVKLNYGIDYCDVGGRSEHFSPVPDTWKKMTDILLFWAAKGIDGFRCDMAEMVPAAFWHYATSTLKKNYPEVVFIGEVYDPMQYRNYIGAGFDYLYDKVGMYDCIRDVICRNRPASSITYQWQATTDIIKNMLYFLENHDEQRIGSDFFAGKNTQRAIPGMIVSALLTNGPTMVYAGQELGEAGMDEEGFSGRDGRSTIFDYWAIPSLHAAYRNRKNMTTEQKDLEAQYTKILNIARKENVIANGEFFDLMYANHWCELFHDNEQYAFIRKDSNDLLLVIANFSDTDMDGAVNIPQHAFDHLQMKEKDVTATDLLTKEKYKATLSATKPFPFKVKANSGVVLRLK